MRSRAGNVNYQNKADGKFKSAKSHHISVVLCKNLPNRATNKTFCALENSQTTRGLRMWLLPTCLLSGGALRTEKMRGVRSALRATASRPQPEQFLRSSSPLLQG